MHKLFGTVKSSNQNKVLHIRSCHSEMWIMAQRLLQNWAKQPFWHTIFVEYIRLIRWYFPLVYSPGVSGYDNGSTMHRLNQWRLTYFQIVCACETRTIWALFMAAFLNSFTTIQYKEFSLNWRPLFKIAASNRLWLPKTLRAVQLNTALNLWVESRRFIGWHKFIVNQLLWISLRHSQDFILGHLPSSLFPPSVTPLSFSCRGPGGSPGNFF